MKYLCFAERAAGDVEEVQVIPPALTSRAFDDIGGNRARSPPQLTGHPINLLPRKSLGCLINRHGQIIRQPPSLNLPKIPHNPSAPSLLVPQSLRPFVP